MTDEPLRRGLLAALAAPALPLAALTLPLVAFVPEHYGNALGMNLATVGLIFMLVRLIDIGLDPLLGALMDGTRTRWGRFRPWLVGGTPVIMAGTAALFFAQAGVGPLYLLVALLVTYTGYSIVTLAQLALSACMSDGYDVRSRIFTWWQAATTGGIILVMVLPTAFGASGGGIVPLMGGFILVVTPLAVAVSVLGVPDRSLPAPAPRARWSDYLALFRRAATRRLMAAELLLGLVGGVTAACGLVYFVAVKRLTAPEYGTMVLAYFLVAILSSPIWTALARRMEKHRALVLASASYVVYLGLVAMVPAGRLDLVLLVSVFGGFSFTASSLLPRAMLADVADEERLDTGADRTGLLYAMLTGIFKIGQALSVGIVFVALDRVGYDAHVGAGNAPGALFGVSAIYIGVTAVFAIGALATMIGYPLTAARHAAIRARIGR